MSEQISVSQYQGQQERSYRTFDVTPEGLAAASAYLSEEQANQFRRQASPWQFEPADSWIVVACERAIHRGNVAEVKRLLSENAPTI